MTWFIFFVFNNNIQNYHVIISQLGSGTIKCNKCYDWLDSSWQSQKSCQQHPSDIVLWLNIFHGYPIKDFKIKLVN